MEYDIDTYDMIIGYVSIVIVYVYKHIVIVYVYKTN